MSGKKRQLPIPEDWDGENWFCIQLEWPDSPKWRAILVGYLSTPQRGREWDAETGDLLATLDTGAEIFDRAFPFRDCVDCSDCPDNPPGTPGEATGGGIVVEGEEEMGQVVTDVKIEDGILKVYFGPCCVREYPLAAGAVATEGDNNPSLPPTIWDESDPPPVYSACGKATAVINALYAVGSAVWDARDELPWSWNGIVEDALPGYDLHDTWITSAVIVAIQVAGLEELVDFDLFDENVKNDLICRLSQEFSDDGEGIDEDLFKKVGQWIQAAWPIFNGQGEPSVFAANLWSYSWQAIGRSDADKIAKLGATQVATGCCDQYDILSDPLEVPDGMDWVIKWNFVYGDDGAFASCDASVWESGRGWVGSENYFDGSVICAEKTYNAADRTGVVVFAGIAIAHNRQSEGVIEQDSPLLTGTWGSVDHELIPIADLPAAAGSHVVTAEDLAESYSGSSTHRFRFGARITLTDTTATVVSELVIAGTGQPPI